MRQEQRMGVLGSWGILSTITRSDTSFSGCNDDGGMAGGVELSGSATYAARERYRVR